jgi:hypothetical protein
MNLKNRIEELNTYLVLKETIIIMLIDDLKKVAIKTDEDNNKKFRFLINEIQHNKNEYNSVHIQLKTLTAYDFKHKSF